MGPLKNVLRDQIVKQLGGELNPRAAKEARDDGWFGPSSAAWKIHSDSCLLMGGIAALLRQTLHPLAMAGVAEFSSYQEDPWGRLYRTSSFLADIVYGDSLTAQENIERVKKIHTKIKGRDSYGREYEASDPRLLTYVHVTEIDGFLKSYENFGGGKLKRGEGDKYIEEMSKVAEALGGANVPRNKKELRECLGSYRQELEYRELAKEAVSFLRNPPAGLLSKIGYQPLFLAACSLIPEEEADMLGLLREKNLGQLTMCGKGVGALLRWVLGPSPVVKAAFERAGIVND